MTPDRQTRYLVLSMAPYRYATRTRKAAVAYRDRGPVTFLSLQGVGRTGKRDSAGTRLTDGVSVHQVPLRTPSTAPTVPSQLSNLLRSYLPAFGRLVREVWRRDGDVVHVTGVPLLVLGLLHQARHGSRLVLDVNERPASVSATGSLFALFRRVEPLLLRAGARRADVTLVVTPGHATLLTSDHGFGEVIVVRNAPLAGWRSAYTAPPAHRAGVLRVVTVGTLFEGRGLEQLIHAVRIARDRGTRVELDVHGAGRPDYAESLVELATRLQVTHQVRFHGRLDGSRVSQAYLAGHLGVALYEPTDAGNDSLSNKILECVTTGRPVLAGDLPENRRFVVDNKVGWLTPVTAEGIAESLVARAAEDDLDDLAGRCRELGDRELTWEAEFGAVFRALDRLHDPRSTAA
ncbi:glycosyltransferase family 4 protein [Pseudonocardia humida]|uniref:Glycosyltransferase family 4 protein n=1 Tax=Pseudonocardia humida TaxID=2800819 RepID=A0ABT0ZT32_9PSEU|nr:glycosyltransferase family 4 protein [Pseudonocardia humida]MCO1653881.1 glycosyltransferase family 4 protein [Pseudonocardia humida]